MNRSLTSLAILALACTLITGCAKSNRQEATGKGALVAVNAIVDAPDIFFQIEQRNLGAAAFGGATTASRYDDLSYTFNFAVPVAGASSSERILSRQLDVVRDTFYLFAVGGTLAAPQLYLWEDAERTWDGTETVFELALANLNNEPGALDVYLLPPGVAPGIGNRLASLATGERLPTAEFATGEYVLTLTAADAPQTVQFRSATLTWPGASSSTLLILDKDPSRAGTGIASVRRVTQAGNSTEIADTRFPPSAQILHGAVALGNVDLAQNDDFGNLLAANLAFGTLTADTALVSGLNSYTFTDAGNQGAVIIDEDISVGDGLRHTFVLVGPDSDPDILTSVSVRRPYATSGRIGFTHAASGIAFVDLYLLKAGETVTDNGPQYAFVPFKTQVPLAAFAADDYELTVTISGEKTIVAGPVALDVANGDVLDVFVLETADPNTASLQVVRYPR
ncbi:MAG: DUF4397 domain-containing protein [Woeseia sp.]